MKKTTKVLLFISFIFINFFLFSCSILLRGINNKPEKEIVIKRPNHINPDGLPNIEIINKLTIELSTANFKIICKQTIKGFPFNSFKTFTGSGILLHKSSDGSLFILTNEHVVSGTGNENLNSGNFEYYVIDYKGNKYSANLAVWKNTGKKVADKSKDLAVLAVSGNILDKVVSKTYNTIKAAKTNPQINEDVFVIGSPDGQLAAITYGQVKGYEKIKYDGDVKFPCISHNAPIAPGSSGGAIVNKNLELVGLIFAGPANQTSLAQSTGGYAIPINEIKKMFSWE